jgi:hypothetical protein
MFTTLVTPSTGQKIEFSAFYSLEMVLLIRQN